MHSLFSFLLFYLYNTVDLATLATELLSGVPHYDRNVLFSSLFLYGCGETETTQKNNKVEAAKCELNLDDIKNTTWLYGKAMAGNTKPIPDSKIRLQFYTEDRQMKARYNMGQPTSMYDYDCIFGPNKVTCSTKPDPVELGLSYFAADKKCTRKALESFLFRKTAGMKLEKKEMREANMKAEEKMLDWKKNGKGSCITTLSLDRKRQMVSACDGQSKC